MKVVFMGTPDFAAAPLRALAEAENIEVALAVTMPDRAVGRKQVITPPPVKVEALRYDIPVFQPATLKNADAIERIRSCAPDMIVVAAYGNILPKEVLSIPPCGCINIHASLLPRYRGAAPIQWAIINGDAETGVTLMRMDEGLDTGDIIAVSTCRITPETNAESLFEELSALGTGLLMETIPLIASGQAVYTKQNEAEASKVAMITKEMAELDFSMSAEELERRVRGFYGWPVAYTFLDGRTLKLHRATVADRTVQAAAGTVVAAGTTLDIACGDGSVLCVEELQAEGKKPMSAREFLNGHKIGAGVRLGRERA